MAYTKTTWVDRIVQFANRYTKSNETVNSVDLVANPGTVTQAGTPLSAGNLNKIEQGIADAHDLIATAATMPVALKHGLNVVTNSQPSAGNVTVYGRTLSNILGRDVCENTVGWNTNGGTATIAQDGSTKLFGDYSLRVTIASGVLGTCYRSLINLLDKTKYYVLLMNIKNGNATNGARLYVDGTGIASNKGGSYVTSTTSYGTSYVKLSPSDIASASSVNAHCYVSGSSGQYVNIDGFRVYEVDAATYAKIDVDSEFTGDKLAEKFPFVDGTKHVQGAAIREVGKNLFPSLTEGWLMHGNAVINGPYSFTLNATAGNQRSTIDVPVIPGQTYSYKYTQTGGGVTVYWWYDKNGTQLTSDNYSATGTAPANAAFMRVGFYANSAGTYTFDNFIMIIGTAAEVGATPFTPYNADYVYLPTILASNLDGSIRDQAYEREGVYYKLKKWQTGVLLDGAQAFTNHPVTVPAGSKRVQLTNVLPSGVPIRVTKYDGIVPVTGDPGVNAESILNNVGVLNMSVPNALTGFSDAHTPLNQDWKNYFNGWKMNNGTLGTAYPGTGTKYWTAIESPRANFVGKIAGSVVENPHIVKYTTSQNTLLAPSNGTLAEYPQVSYDRIVTLNGDSQQHVGPLTSGLISQVVFSFNLIEHVLRKYGSAIFNGAVTTVDRVTWLKANVWRINVNWYGYGSGPAGNKATLARWNGTTWGGSLPTNTTATVAKVSLQDVNPNFNPLIDANGMMHYLVYADASDGTTASTVYTDYIDLEVELNVQTVPATGLATTEFKPYTLDYVLSTAVEEVITGAMGSIAVAPGGNQLELLEGVIVREKVNPVLGTTHYHINNTTYPSSNFSKRTSQILGIFKDRMPDTKWSIFTSGANGLQRAQIAATDFDTSADYFVTYIMLDKYAYTANATDAKVEYQTTLGGTVAQNTQDIADIKTRDGIQDFGLDYVEAKADNLRIDYDTHAAATTGIHGATSAATANAIVQRDANGQTNMGTPTANSHVATKVYVDNLSKQIALGDTVLLSKPDEVGNNGGGLTSFHLAKPGRYRLKGEIRSGTNGSTASFDCRFGLVAPGNLTPDITGSRSTTSSTYSSFSIDLPYIPGHCQMLLFANSGTTCLVRNLTLCGVEVIGDQDVLS